MKVKRLVAGQACDVVAVMVGGACPAEEFLLTGEKSTEAARSGLETMLEAVADLGIGNVPAQWTHAAGNDVYEFIKGPLRLFYFKGVGRQIAVCTTGVRKAGQKADKAAVKKAVELRKQYMESVQGETLQVVDDEENQ